VDAVELVAAVTTPPSALELEEVPKSIGWLQIRSDLIGDIPADWLRSHFPGRLLYTLRTASSGGRFDRSPAERQRRLIAAARDYDLVELEADSDLQPELLGAIPSSRRMLIWRGEANGTLALHSRFQRLSEVPARYYCMILSAARISDGLRPLSLLKSLGRRDIVAFCDGLCGVWSQLLSPAMGAPLLFGNLHDHARKAGEHNAAYRMLKHTALFLPFHSESFEEFWKDMVRSGALDSLGIPIQGLVIVSPYKEAAVMAADSCSSMVGKAGSSNIFAHRHGKWQAETTDPESISAIKKLCPVKAAVIGCGGAGRAVAAALQQTGSQVTLVNRGLQRGRYATQLLGLPLISLSEFRPQGFDVIVNATPVGKDNDGFPFVMDTLDEGTLVVDLAYGSQPTPLVSAVVARGGTAIDGYDVLLTQVRKQFHLMTGLEMPAGISREMVLGRPGDSMPRTTAFQLTHGAAEAYEYSA
jgi:3-dehydroquinate dehydratase/shikimate dehydrogenase